MNKLGSVSENNFERCANYSEVPSYGTASAVGVPTVPSFESFRTIAKATTTKVAAYFRLNASIHREGAEALCHAIAQRYGKGIADSVAAQLQLSSTNAKPLGSYTIKKAITASEKLATLNQDETWVKNNIFDRHLQEAVKTFATVPLTVTRSPVAQAGEMQAEEIVLAGNASESNRNIIFSESVGTILMPASAEEPLQKSYEQDGVKGISSKDAANPNHSVNLWRDVFMWGGKKLFSCVRSGLLAAMKVSKEQRQAVFEKRLHENLTLVLQANQESIQSLLFSAKTEKKDPPGSHANPIALELLDIGLLSNYTFFGFKVFGFGSEHRMKEEQFRLLEQVNGARRQVPFKDSDGHIQLIWVKPTIHALNIGVQRGDGLFASSKDIERTTRATKAVCDYACNYLAKPSKSKLDDLEKSVIEELIDQCRTLASNKTYLCENAGDYYALPARLALLADKVGMGLPMIHCKSGKDRTARLIEEVKFLALQLEINSTRLKSSLQAINQGTLTEDVKYQGLVPQPGVLSVPQKKLLASVVMNSGNQKIQKLNTGIVGNKQGWQLGKRLGVYGIASLLPDPLFHQIYKEYQGDAHSAEV